METLALEVSEDLMALLGDVSESPEAAARQLIVVELYRRSAISLGKGAELLRPEHKS